jgi:CubicO group peptidase (beta-lactamase class C family)
MQMKRLGVAIGAAGLIGSAALAVVYNANGQMAPTDAYPMETVQDAAILKPLFATTQGETRAALLMIDGQIKGRAYAPGYGDQTRFISWSMAKSVTAVLIGELVADGKLRLDAPVPFAEWRKPGDPRGAITLRQLLHMSSGIDHTEGLDPERGAQGALESDTTQALFVRGDRPMAAYALAKGMEAKPGTKYEYSSLTSLLLSELIARALTPSPDPKVRAAAYKAFAEERLFKLAGITSAVMEFDSAGTQIGGSIIYMTLDDWGRFGTLLLDGKGKDGAQAITPDWLAFLRTPSATDSGYGGHVWLNRPRSGENAKYPALFPGKGADSVFAAVGHLGQYVIVSPEQRMVLVRLGKTDDGNLAPVRTALGNVVAAATKAR